jgi:hypothetical protein
MEGKVTGHSSKWGDNVNARYLIERKLQGRLSTKTVWLFNFSNMHFMGMRETLGVVYKQQSKIICHR